MGARRDEFDQVTFSQKREFKLYNPYLRPGALVTLETSGELYNVLFLHADSGTEARDFGNRYEMYEKIWSLKGALNRLADALSLDCHFLVLADLNTMGLLFLTRRRSDRRVSQTEEIKALRELQAVGIWCCQPRNSMPPGATARLNLTSTMFLQRRISVSTLLVSATENRFS
ncbi:MAG: hypothetical protein GTO63_02205 [Anaerolineae bacterium]|nr:hypothetical protein [Anaerolineae bacterium]NIN93868.1 hypothetical protein [Anaerolineae bacterium]NIQ76901.1 hypothetical protein [Anaerolineae bacterium]